MMDKNKKCNGRIVIHTHSVIDVITNSSTEIFLCDTDETCEQIDELLEEMLDLYNKLTGSDLHFDDVFYPSSSVIDYDLLHDYGATIYGSPSIEIRGRSDNSVPYALWKLINKAFGGTNYHLG